LIECSLKKGFNQHKKTKPTNDINRNNHSFNFTLGKNFFDDLYDFSFPFFNITDERFIGEICYQLERRILILIFSSTKHFYGYSLRYLSSIIDNEENLQAKSLYEKRFFKLQNYLLKSHFHFNYHSIITFEFLNKFGIYFDYNWLKIYSTVLKDFKQIQTFCYSIVSEEFHHDLNILLHTLQLISYLDNKPLFDFC